MVHGDPPADACNNCAPHYVVADEVAKLLAARAAEGLSTQPRPPGVTCLGGNRSGVLGDGASGALASPAHRNRVMQPSEYVEIEGWIETSPDQQTLNGVTYIWDRESFGAWINTFGHCDG